MEKENEGLYNQLKKETKVIYNNQTLTSKFLEDYLSDLFYGKKNPIKREWDLTDYPDIMTLVDTGENISVPCSINGVPAWISGNKISKMQKAIKEYSEIENKELSKVDLIKPFLIRKEK